ncbi:MAG: flagellar basal-body rod protein FlgB [Thermoleophilaceae bacterium]|jgi:flagellar basal-body rod protein FlgB|nr:flagellar basal-body rod protein FlgB [Thermoleophilaceae bacterium]
MGVEVGPGTDTAFPSCDPSLVTLIDNTQLALERAISGASMRQSVLANNLANAETPGFQRSDLDFHSALTQAMDSGDSATIEAVQFSPQKDPQTLRADGNGVDIDTESAAMAKNGLEYEALVSVAKSRIEIFQSAMGVG